MAYHHNYCRHGRPPLPVESLFKSANFTLSILPARIAHRIQSLRGLPFIVVSNPNIKQIHDNYVHSLSTLLPWSEKEINTLEDEIKFTETMADLVQTHSHTISVLARGFLEARKYIAPKAVTKFLDEHLRARIGTRLIAEQHIALHFSSQPHRELLDLSDEAAEKETAGHPVDGQMDHSGYIGVIDTQLCPAKVVRYCEGMVGDICELHYGVRPTVEIEGDQNYTIAHIPMHLEYIITELLKNAFRATVEHGMERVPIEITIAPASTSDVRKGISNHDQGNIDEFSGTTPGSYSKAEMIKPLAGGTAGVTIRIRDRGGGISPENYARIWDYSFTTFNEEQASETLSGRSRRASGMDALSRISGPAGEHASSLAGLGYGLPLGRAYAEYFGGGIAVQSMWGWGTDVYLSLRGVGKIE